MNPEPAQEDFLDFKCPYCGSLNSFPTSAAGFPRECVNCLDAFLVPSDGEETARKVPLPIETEKIRMRRFEASDWEDLLEFQFDDEDEAMDWIQRISQARLTDGRETFHLAVEAREKRKVVRSLGLRFIDGTLNQIEVSFFPGKAALVQDWDAEALGAALDFCFRDLNAHRVVAQCGGKDAESRRLFEHGGMRKEGEFVKNYFADGEWFNTVWFAILQEEYLADASGESSAGQSV